MAKAAAASAKGKALFTPDTTPVTASAGAEATALGMGTAATGSIELHGRDMGPVTIVKGVVKASASASGKDTYTDAGTFAAVEGADIVITRTVVSSAEKNGGSGATSQTFVFAIDLNRFDFASGPITIDLFSDRALNNPGMLRLTDNTAVVEANASASGDVTNAETYTDAYSSVGWSQISAYAEIFIG